ncbi:MAG: TolC family protein [Gammaproteobacteria bacterium]|nr:TolC family protein [Gammaproteobacteria bacterium]
MCLKKYLLASALASLMLPVWAVTTPDTQPRIATGLSVAGLSVTGSVSADSQVQIQLQTFIERIWMESPAVQGAQAAVDAARSRREGAGRPLYNPSLELEAERTDINTTTIGLTQTFDWADKRRARTDIASLEIQAALAAHEATKQRTAVEALNVLARYLTAREMRELAVRRSQLMKRFADTVQQRYSAGDMRALDASLARVVYSEALMQQATSEGALAEIEAALRAVSGFDLTSWPQLPQALVPSPEKPDAALLVETLPELMVLRTHVDVARAHVRLAKREGRSDPTIGVRGGREGSESLVGLSFEIPLFIRNNFNAEIQAASYAVVQQEQAYREAYRRASARFDGAWGRFQNMTHAWHVWVATGQQAHIEQVELLQQLWQAGELTATDYLIQAKQNVDTQVAATALVGEVWQAAITWLDASGQVGRWVGITPDAPAQTQNSGE